MKDRIIARVVILGLLITFQANIANADNCGTFNGRVVCPTFDGYNVIESKSSSQQENSRIITNKTTNINNVVVNNVEVVDQNNKLTQCSHVNNQIEHINKRMRHKYTASQGERFRARLRKLKIQRNEFC